MPRIRHLKHGIISRYPDSGGAFKVQIYSPYLVVNKTGVPFNIKSTRSTRTGSPQDVAGDSRPGACLDIHRCLSYIALKVCFFVLQIYSHNPYHSVRSLSVLLSPTYSDLRWNVPVLSHPSAHGHEFALKLGDSALSKVCLVISGWSPDIDRYPGFQSGGTSSRDYCGDSFAETKV